jgi:alkanesulfonate monooxygenase SsuD/methylene tetrahydromethanopterin reductase-like flavin-dependent oxidoreductase (luciferase family)
MPARRRSATQQPHWRPSRQRDHSRSLRITTAIGRATRPAALPEDPDHGTVEGEPDAITEAILRYRDAGVTHIVINSDTDLLDEYLDDLDRFAAEIRPHIPPAGGS